MPDINSRPIIFRVHAVQRLFERHISLKTVRQVLQSGEMIEDYSDEMPAQSGLISAKRGQRPMHVVLAENVKENELVVITVYEPDTSRWKPGFRKRQ
jgi:hypothetical protein